MNSTKKPRRYCAYCAHRETTVRIDIFGTDRFCYSCPLRNRALKPYSKCECELYEERADSARQKGK